VWGLEDYARALRDLVRDLERAAAEKNLSKWLEKAKEWNLDVYLNELPLKAFMECACDKKLFDLKKR